MNLKTAIYARVSTSDGRQDTENQLAELRRFAVSQGWQITGEYIDHESGKSAERSKFKQLFADAARRQFDVVLFWALDRFTREGAFETLQHLNRLSSYGVGFRSFTEPYLDSCGLFKDAIVAILGTIAKQERQRLSERVRAGLGRARAHGTRSGRAIGRPRVVFSKERVLSLRAQGLSWRKIATTLKVSTGSVRRAFRHLVGSSEPCQNRVVGDSLAGTANRALEGLSDGVSKTSGFGSADRDLVSGGSA